MEALEKRKLNVELAVSLGWRSSINGKSGDIEIPYIDESDMVANVKYRSVIGQKTFSQKKDCRKMFYNIQVIPQWQASPSPVIITEGEMDCLVALQCGFMAMSVPDGAPAQEIHDASAVKYSYLVDLPKKGVIILAVDDDKPGHNLLSDLVNRLGAHRCKWVKYPEGCKDLNDVLVRHGEDRVASVIQGAQWCKTKGNYLLSDLPPIDMQKGTELDFIPINIRRGDMSIITGIPNHGKTTVVNYLSYVLGKAGWVTTFASFEQPPQTHHQWALRTMVGGNKPSLLQPNELRHADKWIDEHFNFIVPDSEDEQPADLEWLLERMATAYNHYGSQLFVIDPWNEMEHVRPKDMTQTEYTGFAIRQLKKFATKYEVHVMVVAHPAKMSRSREGKYPVPSLYDIADSAHWANKPDLGIVVHKLDTSSNEATIIVQKSRYKDIVGQTGEYDVTFDPQTKYFSKCNGQYSCS